MIKWEYKTVLVPDIDYGNYAKHLAEEGAKGWRFTGYAVDTGYGTEFLLERQS